MVANMVNPVVRLGEVLAVVCFRKASQPPEMVSLLRNISVCEKQHFPEPVEALREDHVSVEPQDALHRSRKRMCGAAKSGLGAKQQAGVSIGVEPVTALDRVCIGAFHALEAAERGYQHKERRTRQMKISQENIGRTKLITRRDEDIRLAIERLDSPVLRGRAFQKPKRRGADGGDTASARPRGIQRI